MANCLSLPVPLEEYSLEIKPHIWFESGLWKCSSNKNGFLRFWGITPKEAYIARQKYILEYNNIKD